MLFPNITLLQNSLTVCSWVHTRKYIHKGILYFSWSKINIKWMCLIPRLPWARDFKYFLSWNYHDLWNWLTKQILTNGNTSSVMIHNHYILVSRFLLKVSRQTSRDKFKEMETVQFIVCFVVAKSQFWHPKTIKT